MRLNSTGTALYGNTTVYKDGVAVPSLATATAGRWVWMADDLIGGQADFGSGFGLNKVVVSTDTRTNIDNIGANVVAGGGNILLAFLAGGANGGVRTTVSGFGPFPLAALGDADLAGLSALIQNYQAGTGVVTFSATGTSLSNTSVTLAGGSEIRAKTGLYAYRDAAGSHLRSLSAGATLQAYAPRTGDITFQLIPFVVGGVTWVVEAVGSGVSTLSLRPATSSSGFLITTGDTFNLDVCSPSAGVLRIGWCINSGETQTSLRMADVTLATGGLTNWTTTTGTLASSAGTPITSSPFTVGPVEGGSLSSTKQPRQAAKADGTGFTGAGGIRQYQAWWDTLASQAVAAPNLSQATGVLQPAQGGTGTTSGLTNMDGGNLLAGTVNTTQLAPMLTPTTQVPPFSLSMAANQSAVVNRSLTLGATVKVSLASGARLRIL